MENLDKNELVYLAKIEVQKRRKEMTFDCGAFPFPVLDFDVAKRVFWECCKNHVEKNKAAFPSGYNIDAAYKSVLPHIVRWLIFDTEGAYDLQRGLYIFGQTGRGKTHLVKIMQAFSNCLGLLERQFSHISVPQIYTCVEMDGGKMNPSFLVKNHSALFDDVFFTVGKKVFGNQMSEIVEPEILRARNEVWGRSQGSLFSILTSNESPERTAEILDGEEGRNYSRLVEMCNFVDIGDGENFRYLRH